MFRVDQRFSGQGLWDSSALPMTLQVATTFARTIKDTKFADEIRVVQLNSPSQLFDIKV